jgi:outer membrane protein assembly factor BamB
MRVFLSVICSLIAVTAMAEWNQFRGAADGQGLHGDAKVPLKWGANANIKWKADIPGRGSSSPIFHGGKVFITTADEDAGTQLLLAYDKATGKKLWTAEALKGKFLIPSHRQNSEASATPVCDGERIITYFGINKASWLVAFDLDGKKLYTEKVSDFDSRFGLGASPVLHDGILIVPHDNAPDNFVAGYDPKTGKQLWKTKRKASKTESWNTPRVFTVRGKPTLVLAGAMHTAGYDPKTGKELWSVPGGSDTTVGCAVMIGDAVYHSGGYPQRCTVAVDLSGTPKKLWQNSYGTYISSVLAVNGYLYGASNKGHLACMDAKTGKVLWTEKMKSGDVLSSPMYINGHILVTTEKGRTKILKPNPKKFDQVGENTLPGVLRATLVPQDGNLYYRAERILYCIGK